MSKLVIVIAIAGLLVAVRACIMVLIRKLTGRRRASRRPSQRHLSCTGFPGSLPVRTLSDDVSSWLSPLTSGDNCPAREKVRKFE